MEDLTSIALWEQRISSLNSPSLFPNFADATTASGLSLALQSSGVSLANLAPYREASQSRMWDCYLDGNPS